MELNYQLEDINKSNLKADLKNESPNYFDLCQKCSAYQNNLKDWMKHLVDRHPLPIQWMSDMATLLTGDKLSKPYTTVTESRKKRKKHVTPRPLNSFMIFSRHLRRNVLIFFSDASNSEISKLLGKLWNNIPSHIKSMYDNEAKSLAALHAKEFPDYKYQPKKKKKQYLTKCANEDFTLLSSISYENNKDICSVSDTFHKSHSLQRESNSASVSSYGSTQESKSNSFMNHQKSSNLKKEINHKINRKSVKQSFNVIPNQIIDDSEGAESSPSSFKNTVKNEIHSNYSPFINESHSIFSDLSYSSSLANLTKYNSDSVITNSPKREEIVLQDYKTSQLNCSTHFRHFFQKTTSNNLLTPLTIVTDKVDDSKDFQSSRMNIRFVKINRSLIQKSNISLNHISQNIIDQPTYPLGNASQEIHIGVGNNVFGNYFTTSRNTCNINLNNSLNQEINRKRVNMDPLIIENMFENDNFEEDNLNLDNIDNNNGSPWSFKSPNFKISTGSSTLSDNPYKESFCSSSPFHLSENETNPIPIQRLPAIGSWLKSNHSEFMI